MPHSRFTRLRPILEAAAGGGGHRVVDPAARAAAALPRRPPSGRRPALRRHGLDCSRHLASLAVLVASRGRRRRPHLAGGGDADRGVGRPRRGHRTRRCAGRARSPRAEQTGELDLRRGAPAAHAPAGRRARAAHRARRGGARAAGARPDERRRRLRPRLPLRRSEGGVLMPLAYAGADHVEWLPTPDEGVWAQGLAQRPRGPADRHVHRPRRTGTRPCSRCASATGGSGSSAIERDGGPWSQRTMEPRAARSPTTPRCASTPASCSARCAPSPRSRSAAASPARSTTASPRRSRRSATSSTT